MAGRRRARRASTSTVATVNEASLQFFRESDILKPTTPGQNHDDWPCFLLTDATIYDKKGNVANLLHVDLEGPFTCRGQLAIEQDQSHFLARGHARTRSAWIEIPNIYSYSMGLDDSTGIPMPALWAMGDSRWFEIKPSEKYTPIANIMFQGISLYYHILDQYIDALDELTERESQKPKSKRRKNLNYQDVDLPLKDIFLGYAVAVGDGVTEGEVIKRCKEQAGFILSSKFPKGTGFHSWLTDECPNVVKALSKKGTSTAAPAALAKPELPKTESKTKQRASGSVEAQDVKGKGKAVQRGSLLRSSQNNEQVEVASVDSDEDELLAPKSVKGKRKTQHQAKVEATEPADVEMRDVAAENEAVLANATNAGPSASAAAASGVGLAAVLSVLNEERAKYLDEGKKHPDRIAHTTWTNKVYLSCTVKHYASKHEVLEYFAADLARHMGPEWHNSELYTWAKQQPKSRPNLEWFTEGQLLALARRHAKTAHSAVKDSQPASSPVGKKPRRGRPSGKAAGLRPSIGGKKRVRDSDSDSDDMDIDPIPPRKKTAKTSEYFADGDNDGEVHSAASDAGDEQAQDANKTPLKRVVIRTEKLPSTAARGPNHTWTCDEPDCGYIVRGANEDDGQDIIRKHYEEHEKEADHEAKERANLAIQEGTRTHLPFNHLLEKIRRAGAKVHYPSTTIGDRVVPEPIARTLLV